MGALAAIDQQAAPSACRVPAPARQVAHFRRWLTLLGLGALGLRLGVIALAHGERVSGDGYEWSRQGNLNAAGHWFVSPFTLRPDALRPPGWALVLTVWAWLGQHTWFRQQLLACAIGTATVVVTALAARRIAGDREALLAAAIAALYPGLWVYERPLLSETLLIFEVAVTILMAYRFRERPSLVAACVLGGMCGVLALTRSEQILVVPLVVLPLILGERGTGWRAKGAHLAAAVVILGLVVSGWTFFNLDRFQRPVFLSNGFGAAAASGNCQETYYGPEIGYGDLRCVPLFVKGDQSVQDGEDAQTALRFAEHHLGRVPLVLVAREGRTFGFWNPFQQARIDANWMGSWLGVTDLELISFWLLLVPAAYGIITLRRRHRAIYPLLAFGVTAVVAVLPTIGDPRYRAAGEVPLVILAATGIGAVARRRPAGATGPVASAELGDNAGITGDALVSGWEERGR